MNDLIHFLTTKCLSKDGNPVSRLGAELIARFADQFPRHRIRLEKRGSKFVFKSIESL
jgi:hypothetical protein